VHRYCRTHFADATLIDHARSSRAGTHFGTADLLADLAEMDVRKLYAPAAYSSMVRWCRGELHMEEQEAYKLIRAARAAREFPVLFEAVADGRLHLTAVILLKPRLTKENAEELIAAAKWRTREEIELLLATRFPRWTERPRANVPNSQGIQLSPGTVTLHTVTEEAPGQTSEEGPGRQAPALEMTPPLPGPGPVIGRARLTPVSADAFDFQVTIRRDTRDLIRRAQDLLGRGLPPSDMDALLNQVLRQFVKHRERRKFGRTDRPRPTARTKKSDNRYITAEVRRAVAERDQGRCTYTSEIGKRCDATHGLEYDHIVPFAQGGTSTADNLRLRCRTHNQYEAEQSYGAAFIKNKREQARAARRAAPGAGGAAAAGPDGAPAAAGSGGAPAAQVNVKPNPVPSDPDLDVRPSLRSLGIRAKDAERAQEFCATLTDATLEERVKAALSFLVPPHRRPVTSHLPAAGPAEDASAA
jgi:5-methylcytosine-specific restriction endonuclease McrA